MKVEPLNAAVKMDAKTAVEASAVKLEVTQPVGEPKVEKEESVKKDSRPEASSPSPAASPNVKEAAASPSTPGFSLSRLLFGQKK